MAEREAAEFEKQVVQLADGRQLIFYRFVNPSPSPAPEPARPAPDSQEG